MGARKKAAAGAAAMSAVALATLLGATPASGAECYQCPTDPGVADPFWKFTLDDLPGGSDSVFDKHAPEMAFDKLELVFDKHDELPANFLNVFEKFGG